MKYVFYGTPEFAAIILRKLIPEGMPPLAIITNPDRPHGRKIGGASMRINNADFKATGQSS